MSQPGGGSGAGQSGTAAPPAVAVAQSPLGVGEFVGYVGIGFGATLLLMALGGLGWWLARRAVWRRRRAAQPDTSLEAAEAGSAGSMDSVQQLLTAKLFHKPRQPVLVVHPGAL